MSSYFWIALVMLVLIAAGAAVLIKALFEVGDPDLVRPHQTTETTGGASAEALPHPLQGCDFSPDGYCDYPDEAEAERCRYCGKYYDHARP